MEKLTLNTIGIAGYILNRQTYPDQKIVSKCICETCTMYKMKPPICTADCDAAIGGREEGKCVYTVDKILAKRPDGLKGRMQ